MKIENNHGTLSEIFGGHFSNKVHTLSKHYITSSCPISSQNDSLSTSLEEIRTAASTLKLKHCYGNNKMPMKIIKNLGIQFPELFVNLFNLAAKFGMPTAWKTAVVAPLHKKGNRTYQLPSR